LPPLSSAPEMPIAAFKVEGIQCLDRRIADNQILIDEIAAWQHD
jgi:hypothetical protein